MASPSPPTERVVAVLNLLATEDDGLSAFAVAKRTGLSASTCAALLATLDRAGYVERSTDKRYRLGSGLFSLFDGLRRRHPVLGAADEELRGLREDLGCACTLTRHAVDHLVVVASDGGLTPDGTRSGDRFPIDPPYGSLAIAWRPPAEIERWLDRTPVLLDDVDRAHHRRVIDCIRERGWGGWSLEPSAGPVVKRVQEILESSADAPGSAALHDQLTRLLASFGRHGYTSAELAGKRPLSVSYIIAPVFGPDAQPRYQVDLHLLQSSMARAEIDRHVERLLAATRSLTAVIGGREPAARRTARKRGNKT